MSLAGFSNLVMFKGMYMSLPKRKAPKSCSTWVGSGLTHRYLIGLEIPEEDEHSSLFVLLVSFKENNQITLIPGVNVAKQFFFVIDAQHIKLERLSLACSLIYGVKAGMEHLTLTLTHKYLTKQK